MADTVTPNLDLVQPQVGGSDGSWAGKMNDNMSTIDSFSQRVLRFDDDIDDLPAVADRAGKVLGFDADGQPSMVAVSGTSDPSLRSDLAATTGATLVKGSDGQSVQLALDFLNQAAIRESLAWPPFAPFNCSTVVPSSLYPFVGVRLDSTTWLFRVNITSTGFMEEYVYQRVNYAGVTDGIQLLSHKTYTPSKVYHWLQQSSDPGARTTTEFAFRTGKITDTYSDINTNINGFGHGRMTAVSTAVLQLNGTGSNLIETAGWAAGIANIKFGTSITCTTTFHLLTPDNTNGIQLVFTQTIDGTFSLRETGFFQAETTGICFQDSPLSMRAFSKGPGFAPVNRVKLNGIAQIVTITSDGVQKPTFPSTWDGTNTSQYYQAYDVNNPTIVPTLRSSKTVIQDQATNTMTPYQWCNSVKVCVDDQTTTTKIEGFAQSTTSAFPRNPQAISNGVVYYFDNFHYTQYLPGGPI